MEKTIQLKQVGTVYNNRNQIIDDYWGSIESIIKLNSDSYEKSATDGLNKFSHIEVLFYMDRVDQNKIITAKRHPRNNINLPKVGILAQRGKNRPNQIASSIAQLISVNDLELKVIGLDAINNTPVLDIKPYFLDMIPNKKSIKEPNWVFEISKNYF